VQSIFSVAARRRKVLEDTANSKRRAGALKMLCIMFRWSFCDRGGDVPHD
jgi:hypothetical protein